MSSSPLAGLQVATVGSTCAVELNENVWAFVFTRSDQPTCTITVESIWRLIEDGRIAVTSEDHGHPFGLPEPVHAEGQARRGLADKSVLEIAVDRTTGDLTMVFAGGVRVQVLTTSGGYESWQAYFRSGDEDIILVDGGGGALSWVSSPAGSKPQVLHMRPLA
jgi:hypothetical protein